MKVAKRLKALEVENAKLKRLVVEVLLTSKGIQEFLEKSLNTEGRHTMLAYVENKGFSQRTACRWAGYRARWVDMNCVVPPKMSRI
ncbi:hypothetical protein MASR2M66_29670 [Chloroflexota bacterium]